MTDLTIAGTLYVGEGVTAQCKATVPGEAIINGKFSGVLQATGLQVLSQGVVSGTTSADVARIDGQINDELLVTDTLSIGAKGVAAGNILYGRIEVAKGGELRGKLSKI
jgi:cytoskeletal protein CcmA (bactofilin family)